MYGHKRVVVTGYGAVTSLGETGDEVWEAILAKRLGYRVTATAEEKTHARFFGFLEPNRRRLAGGDEGVPGVLGQGLEQRPGQPFQPAAVGLQEAEEPRALTFSSGMAVRR